MKKFNKPTTLRTRIKKLVNDLNNNFRSIGEEFDAVNQRIDVFNQFKKEVYELRDEIATNGVVRDLAKLRMDHKELRENTSIDVNVLYRKFENLERNGVATAINKLNAEVFDKKVDDDTSDLRRLIYKMVDVEPAQKVTLRGKLDAVIEHLGLDISVKPRHVEEAKIVTKKVKTSKVGKK